MNDENLGFADVDIDKLPAFKYNLQEQKKYVDLVEKTDVDLTPEEKTFKKDFEEALVVFRMKVYNHTKKQVRDHIKNIKNKIYNQNIEEA